MTATQRCYAKKVANGWCTRCGRQLPENNKIKTCEDCRKILAKQRSEYKQRLRDNHKCIVCGVQLEEEYSFKTCEQCKEKAKAFRRRVAPIFKVTDFGRLTEFGYEELNNCYRKTIKGLWIIRIDKQKKSLKYWHSGNGQLGNATPYIQDLLSEGIVYEC
jgi:hypothetical protein